MNNHVIILSTVLLIAVEIVLAVPPGLACSIFNTLVITLAIRDIVLDEDAGSVGEVGSVGEEGSVGDVVFDG